MILFKKIMKYFYLALSVFLFLLIFYQVNNITKEFKMEYVWWIIFDVVGSIYWGYQYIKAR
jgi:uncharacterized membrane protein